MSQSYQIPCWPYTYGGPAGQGTTRTQAEDFIVVEIPAFELSGAGEHAYVKIEKRTENTEYVARKLAKFAQVPSKHISYAGLKDRQAKTTQWFSVWLPGKADPDWSAFNSETIKVTDSGRHTRKLKRGVLAGNQFTILIRDWQGDKDKTENILTDINKHGIANYFGNQRFGRDGRNVNNALALFTGVKMKRHQKSIYLSSARSYLFNQVLALRVLQDNWNKAINGDTLIFDKSGSYFQTDDADKEICQRVETGNIHPTGMLWGTGNHEVSSDALAIEKQIAMQNQTLATGLEKAGLTMSRRALRVNVEGFQWHFNDQTTLELKFFLPSGSYATAVLREIINF